MPQAREKRYTAEDYWNLPEGSRAELIGGCLYAMAPPGYKHQLLVMELAGTIRDYIRQHNGSCKVLPAPFAVNLNANDETYVEPDISVICDSSKLTDRGCTGAPDLIIEIVSPSSRKMDYSTKNALYADAGVREYWIVDPSKNQVIVYRFDTEDYINSYSFTDEIPVGIYDGELKIRIKTE